MTTDLIFMLYSDVGITSGFAMTTRTKSEEAVKRRVWAARLLQAGRKPAEVAALVGAPRQTVYRRKEILEIKGIDALREISKADARPCSMPTNWCGCRSR
jgi:hypothetical protein